MTTTYKPKSVEIDDREHETDIFFEIGIDRLKSYELTRELHADPTMDFKPDFVVKILLQPDSEQIDIEPFVHTLSNDSIYQDPEKWPDYSGIFVVSYTREHKIQVRLAYQLKERSNLGNEANAVFHIIDLNKENSFGAIHEAFSKIQELTSPSCIHVFVGFMNSNQPETSLADLKQWAYLLGATGVAAVNPKTGLNINTLLAESLREVMRKMKMTNIPSLINTKHSEFSTQPSTVAKSLTAFSAVFSPQKNRFGAATSTPTTDAGADLIKQFKTTLAPEQQLTLSQFINSKDPEEAMNLLQILIKNVNDMKGLQDICTIAQSKADFMKNNEDKVKVKAKVLEKAKAIAMANKLKMDDFKQELNTFVNIFSPPKSKPSPSKRAK